MTELPPEVNGPMEYVPPNPEDLPLPITPGQQSIFARTITGLAGPLSPMLEEQMKDMYHRGELPDRELAEAVYTPEDFELIIVDISIKEAPDGSRLKIFRLNTAEKDCDIDPNGEVIRNKMYNLQVTGEALSGEATYEDELFVESSGVELERTPEEWARESAQITELYYATKVPPQSFTQAHYKDAMELLLTLRPEDQTS